MCPGFKVQRGGVAGLGSEPKDSGISEGVVLVPHRQKDGENGLWGLQRREARRGMTVEKLPTGCNVQYLSDGHTGRPHTHHYACNAHVANKHMYPLNLKQNNFKKKEKSTPKTCKERVELPRTPLAPDSGVCSCRGLPHGFPECSSPGQGRAQFALPSAPLLQPQGPAQGGPAWRRLLPGRNEGPLSSS